MLNRLIRTKAIKLPSDELVEIVSDHVADIDRLTAVATGPYFDSSPALIVIRWVEAKGGDGVIGDVCGSIRDSGGLREDGDLLGGSVTLKGRETLRGTELLKIRSLSREGDGAAPAAAARPRTMPKADLRRTFIIGTLWCAKQWR